eukprot:TRINITY_DN20381_c0_g1_i2.p1 TRINITY_DN20381_c0_g1~~TRINITY_DN20381_c0_g1_i2.p1  ORF type:complete len:111 (-),score=8.74 TRINITY_DN20381_c0_g1_i2:78-410(-)
MPYFNSWQLLQSAECLPHVHRSLLSIADAIDNADAVEEELRNSSEFQRYREKRHQWKVYRQDLEEKLGAAVANARAHLLALTDALTLVSVGWKCHGHLKTACLDRGWIWH